MLQITGSLNKAFGKRYNQVNFMVPDGVGYRKVGSRYFSDDETTVKYKKMPYIVGLDRVAIKSGNANILYIKLDKDKPQVTMQLSLQKETKDGLSPEEYDNISFTGHVKVALKNAVTGNTGILITVMGFGIGILAGFLIGSNIEGITTAISGPTPTPSQFPNMIP